MDSNSKANVLAEDFNVYFKDNLQNQLFQKQSEKFLAPATRLLKKKQEEHDVNKALRAVKYDFNNTVVNQRLRKEEIRGKEKDIKTHLAKFDQFLKENEMKRVRAKKKAERERKLTQQKSAELRTLEGELLALTQERERLASLAEKNEIYPDYLLRVVKLCKQFEEPRQVMARFDTLVQTREDLLQSSRVGEALVNNALAQLAQYIEHTNDRIIHYNNQLAKLQTELDTISSQAMLWDSRWAHIQNTAAKKTLLLGTVKIATLNLFVATLGKEKDHQGVSPEDTLQQLSKIQSFLLNLIGIMEVVSKQDHKELRC